MGYDIRITREEGSQKISKEEWLVYIESDSELELIHELPTNKSTFPTPNTGLWKTDQYDVLFPLNEEYGEITVKNPDPWIIDKMLSIANALNAIVEGDEGERYDDNAVLEFEMALSKLDSNLTLEQKKIQKLEAQVKQLEARVWQLENEKRTLKEAMVLLASDQS